MKAYIMGVDSMTVKVSKAFYQEIDEIKKSGKVDINDTDAVLEYATTHGYSVAMRMIQGNPNRYLRCISDGMDATE